MYYDLPRTYCRDQIPCCISDIPTSENIRDLKRLEPIANYRALRLNCDAGLLLGHDFTKAITIKEVIEPPESRAQAVRYALLDLINMKLILYFLIKSDLVTLHILLHLMYRPSVCQPTPLSVISLTSRM